MSIYGDYMDGVPVKISEKFKPPPKIELPHSVSDCSSRAQNVVDNANYCFTFETNVLSKLQELRTAKETIKNERRHRLQLLEEAKQKQLDLIAAAEAEEKLKQLSVSEVSYPSTEEISEISPDDKIEKNNTQEQSELSPTLPINEINDHTYAIASTTESQMNILQPIQLPTNSYNTNLLDDPDPLQEFKMHSRSRNPHLNHFYSTNNIDKLTYHDFEHDTSSPFDNMELKTINDLELLAQVLQHQKTTSNDSDQPNVIQNQGMNYTIPMNGSFQTTYDEQQPIVSHTLTYPTQNYPMNGYYMTENCDTSVPLENPMYIPNYNYYSPSMYTQSVDTGYYSSSTVQGELENQTYVQPYNLIPVYPQNICPDYVTAMQNENAAMHENNLLQSTTLPLKNDIVTQTISQNSVKSRSKSITDIVRELNEELVSARLRFDERSTNGKEISSQSSSSIEPSCSIEKKPSKHRVKQKLLNPFDKLPTSLQSLCRNIESMGFPLDRVARVCTIVGDNDKKIIEGLLMLDELMDLGFSESRVSAALAKHEFNKDKALDELVA